MALIWLSHRKSSESSENHLIANISGTTPYVQNRKETWSTAIPPAFQEESPVNFGPQTKKFYWLTVSHRSGFFRGDYISALKGCCPLKFSYALEIDQASKKFWSWKFKIWLKIRRISPYNFRASGSIFVQLFEATYSAIGSGHDMCITFGRPAP